MKTSPCQNPSLPRCCLGLHSHLGGALAERYLVDMATALHGMGHGLRYYLCWTERRLRSFWREAFRGKTPAAKRKNMVHTCA